ncbi:hypothetical protein ABPG74_014577 [Tetrahymena malaccensis]
MTSKIQKKAFNNNYNHHKIFNDGEDLEEVEQQQLNEKFNVLEIEPQQRREEKRVNPTYKSQIFSSDYDEIPQFRKLQGQQQLKDQTSEQLFGVHGDMMQRKKRSNKSTTEEQSANQAVVKKEDEDQQKQSSAKKQTKDKQMVFNAMWWDNSSKPNNDLNQYKPDFAKQRKLQDYSSNNIFQTESSVQGDIKVQKNQEKVQTENNQNKQQKFNIISNMNEDQVSNTSTMKYLADQKQNLQQQIQGDIDARKANRNYSNLFGRCQTPLIAQNVGHENEKTADFSKNVSTVNNKSELFLPTNANIDQFDSKKYNPKTDKENKDVNACQRYFKNLQSVLDTHTFQAEYKRGVLINKEKPAIYEGGNILDNFSEIRSELLSENNAKPPKQAFIHVGEMEKIQQLEFKNMKTHFDQENFKRFCVQKGYKVLVFTSSSNGRGSIFLRLNRKNPDPVDSIISNLKINGVNIALQKEITGKEFNQRNFEAPALVKKQKQIARPLTGKKQFSGKSSNIQSHNIFKEEKKAKEI